MEIICLLSSVTRTMLPHMHIMVYYLLLSLSLPLPLPFSGLLSVYNCKPGFSTSIRELVHHVFPPKSSDVFVTDAELERSNFLRFVHVKLLFTRD